MDEILITPEMLVDFRWKNIKILARSLIVKYEWALSDHATITPVKKAQAEVYIQSLKDIPQTYDLADDVEFPEVPQFLLDWESGL